MVSAETKQPIFKPWVVLNKSFKATDAGGKAVDVTLKVGVIGFAPPPILQWDKGQSGRPCRGDGLEGNGRAMCRK